MNPVAIQNVVQQGRGRGRGKQHNTGRMVVNPTPPPDVSATTVDPGPKKMAGITQADDEWEAGTRKKTTTTKVPGRGEGQIHFETNK